MHAFSIFQHFSAFSCIQHENLIGAHLAAPPCTQAVADSAASALQIDFQLAVTPCMALAAYVLSNPYFPALNASFPTIGAFLMAQPQSAPVLQLELLPFGRIEALYPFLPGNEVSPKL